MAEELIFTKSSYVIAPHTTNVDEFLNFKYIGNSEKRKEVIYKVYIHPLPLCCLQNGQISIKFNFYYIQFNAAH